MLKEIQLEGVGPVAEGLTVTVRVPGMFPLAGVTLSHAPPVVVVAVAEKVPVPPPTSETVTI